MICYSRLINGSKQHINPSNEQKVRQERQHALSCLWLSRMTSMRLTIAQQYKRHLFQKEDQKAPNQKMTWFPTNIQKGTRMSDRVRPIKLRVVIIRDVFIQLVNLICGSLLAMK